MNISALSQRFRKNIQTYIIIIALVVIWGVFAIVTKGGYLSPQNISNLFRQMTVTSFLAAGMVLVMVTGGIDLSVGKLAGFVSVVVALFQRDIWFKIIPDQPILAAALSVCGGVDRWFFVRYISGLYHCLFTCTGFHCDPGWHVHLEWRHSACTQGTDHCGKPTRFQ